MYIVSTSANKLLKYFWGILDVVDKYCLRSVLIYPALYKYTPRINEHKLNTTISAIVIRSGLEDDILRIIGSKTFSLFLDLIIIEISDITV